MQSLCILFILTSAKIHKTLRVTSAIEAGLTKELMEIKDIVNLVDKYAKNNVRSNKRKIKQIDF